MIKAHLAYLRYVLRHKLYVFQECLKYGLVWQGITHDWSKFLPSEWIPYTQYFYGEHRWETVNDINGIFFSLGASEKDTKAYWKERFNEAWNHHQKRQPHHWQYWVLLNDSGSVEVLPMPDEYRKEMLADWRGAGRAINGVDETATWYAANKDKMQLHPDTRRWVEKELAA